MAGFFDKIKQGASKVSDKAQQTVEITKLSSQISSKKKEIDRKHSEIGIAVFQAFKIDDISSSEGLVVAACEEIVRLQKEIDGIEVKIKEAKNEKDCTCGIVVPLDTKYCPDCGHHFETIIAD